MSFRGFVEGGLASIVAGCSTHPLDLIKLRMQLEAEAASSSASDIGNLCTGPISVGMKLVQAEGVNGLFGGLSATILRQGLYSTTRMGLYEILKQQWRDQNGGICVLKKLAAGMVAGAAGAVVGNPADVAMVRMQADALLPEEKRKNYRGVADTLVDMVKHEGVGSLWIGSSLTIQRAMVVTACQLAAYDHVKEAIVHSNVLKGHRLLVYVAASSVAGLAAAVASTPIDVVRTRIMNMKCEPGCPKPYDGPLDCAIKMLRHEGGLALYKGFLPTFSRQAPFSVVLFLTLEHIRRLPL